MKSRERVPTSETHTHTYIVGRGVEELKFTCAVAEGAFANRGSADILLPSHNLSKLMFKKARMGCPLWMLALAMLCASGLEVRAQCWENTGCRDLSSDRNILECIKLCKSELTEESPIYPGDGHLQPILYMPNEISAATLYTPQEDEAPVSGPQHEEKRSYSMEHFRWGKPVGRKRRPIKVYANGVEEESAETLPAEMRRELGDAENNAISQQEKKDGSYKMNHFRWSGPPTSKRYGGFMKSWDERSQKPLLTLFKNIINKDGHQKKDH